MFLAKLFQLNFKSSAQRLESNL